MQLPQKISEIKAYQKPHDSIFSTLFTRHLSRVFTFYLVRWDKKVTPNKISLLSFLIGVLACVLFLDLNYWVRILGVVLLQISFALDCSDGEIARLKNMGSKFGAWFDSANDRVKEIFMFGALTYAWYISHSELYVILLGAGTIVMWLLVGYLREAKKSSWPNTRTAEMYITKNIYIGTVDVTIYLVCAAIIFKIELYILALFFLVSIPLVLKQVKSAWKLGRIS